MLKSGVVVPVYKGGGKDPKSVHSYRGVTLTSVGGGGGGGGGRFWNFSFWRG